MIKKFKIYIQKTKVHQVAKNAMMETFGLVVITEICERMHENGHVNSSARFEERLCEEHFYEGTEKLNERSLLNRMEQQPRKHMDPAELLREFEKKYSLLPLVKKCCLNTKQSCSYKELMML